MTMRLKVCFTSDKSGLIIRCSLKYDITKHTWAYTMESVNENLKNISTEKLTYASCHFDDNAVHDHITLVLNLYKES